MTKELWINLPVKDLDVAKAFFTKVGFNPQQGPGNTAVSASFTIGSKNIVIMLFAEAVFRSFTGNGLPETGKATEVLFSLDAESREEVDEWASKVSEAGGNVFAAPGESQGWMYGCGFADPDGHRWNILYMDMSKMQAGS